MGDQGRGLGFLNDDLLCSDTQPHLFEPRAQTPRQAVRRSQAPPRPFYLVPSILSLMINNG